MNRRALSRPRSLSPRAPLPERDALVCSYCGAVSAFDAGVPSELLGEALSRGFVVHRHRLLIFGRCSACRSTPRELRS